METQPLGRLTGILLQRLVQRFVSRRRLQQGKQFDLQRAKFPLKHGPAGIYDKVETTTNSGPADAQDLSYPPLDSISFVRFSDFPWSCYSKTAEVMAVCQHENHKGTGRPSYATFINSLELARFAQLSVFCEPVGLYRPHRSRFSSARRRRDSVLCRACVSGPSAQRGSSSVPGIRVFLPCGGCSAGTSSSAFRLHPSKNFNLTPIPTLRQATQHI